MAYQDQHSQYNWQPQGRQSDPQQQFHGNQDHHYQSNMAGHNPHLGATFYPGGVDDFYMPEVISPSPQRVMPEVPEQIQENLAHLELESNASARYNPPEPSHSQHYSQGRPYQDPHSTGSAGFPARGASLATNQYGGYGGYGHQELDSHNTGAGAYQTHGNSAQTQGQHSYNYQEVAPKSYDPAEQPSFSPFPKLQNPPPNVPPSDEEKEALLESTRVPVLNSNDPEMQLAWAQDALAYVEGSIQHERRITENDPNQAPRPQTPRVEHQLRVDAINVVSFLADQGHPKAEFMRGMWLEFAKFGFRVDKKDAFRCYMRAAEKGYARAEYRMGMQFENSNEPMKAIKHYNQGAALGDSASNYRLGMMTLLGQHGQKQDFVRGVHLVRLAAESADENAPQGAYVYGMLLARELPGIDIPETFLPLDTKAARTYIEKAAYLGFARAQLKMGQAYELCQLGCEFNAALSLHYNALAARQGEPEADMAISKWFLCGQEGVFERNEELAFTYAQRAAQSGLPTAEFAMGYFYEIGVYVSVDLKEAQIWYQKAAEHGNKDALGRLDGISKSKTLSKDHERVAIARIQSMHGSQRGSRPERFKTPAPPLPTIKDESIDMPEPSISTGAPQLRYPDQSGGGQAIPRPASAAPYPTEDGPPRISPRLGPGAGLAPGVRPSSAFGLNPNIRPMSGAGPPARPFSTAGDIGGRGRGAVPGGRVVSGGPGPAPYGAPTGRGRGGSPGTGRPQDDLNVIAPPRLDIGFSAPLEPERKHKLQKTNVNKPQPVPPPTGFEAPADSHPLKPSRTPATQQPVSQGASYGPKPNSLSGHPQSTHSSYSVRPPPRKESMVPAVASRPPNTHSQSAPPPKTSTPATSAPQQPQKTSSTSTVPGKGPKTFEEMGVPQGKKDEDCLVM